MEWILFNDIYVFFILMQRKICLIKMQSNCIA